MSQGTHSLFVWNKKMLKGDILGLWKLRKNVMEVLVLILNAVIVMAF